ncbi:MAG: S-layer family protein, partial [Cyanobacteria bacterium J06638_38]
KAGNLTINTKRLLLETGGSISTASFSGGKAGNLLINASELVQINGTTIDNEDRPSILTASSSGTGTAGDITIITSALQIKNGAILRSRTAADSDAGNIILQVIDSIILTGENSGIIANTAADSSGNGGSISIAPTREVTIREQAQIAVDSQGSGQGGDIELETDNLTLDRGLISAETVGNQGGNLNLTVNNLLLLRNGSDITATAGTSAAGGDGGNINLTTNFLVAPPTEDNNITANAFTGQGGNVQITAQGIFGIEFRPAETSFSDITASSEFGLSGIVVLNTPDVDVLSDLVKLPDQPISVQPLEGCRASSGGASSFVRTGKGGLPSNPYDLLETTNVLDDLSLPQEWSEMTREVPKQIVKATGWIINEEGMVELVAQKPSCL